MHIVGSAFARQNSDEAFLKATKMASNQTFEWYCGLRVVNMKEWARQFVSERNALLKTVLCKKGGTLPLTSAPPDKVDDKIVCCTTIEV